MPPILHDRISTPLGPMALMARDGVLLALEFDEEETCIAREMRRRFPGENAQHTDNPFGFTALIGSYFAGDLSAIDGIPADGGGTEFERQVWAELRRIPCGETQSYGEVARRLGDPNLSRAVGIANSRNHNAIVVPCHRVIGSDGTLTGYAGGLHRKQWLLRHEHAPAVAQGDLFSI
ncbi:methylated-DNA--[protein]-cysteine S-methyltransferase [Aestuariivirga sp.]|uniref:methylated-DNA--[protein]-cysteine S-methyltransferase n=1 Tax=Aestuariivirga sp. TaxID=2650926 RepID=UPI0039E682EB